MPSYVSLPPFPGEVMPEGVLEVSLTEASTFLDVSRIGLVRLTSDDTTPANRLLSFGPGQREFQKITLTFDSGGGTTCLISTASSPIIRVKANWKPLQYETITFIWSAGIWQELSRGPAGGDYIDVPAYNSSWTSTCLVSKFAGGAMAVMKGTFESTINSNANPIGIFPVGYEGSFSMQVTALIGGSISQTDIGTSSNIFGTTPVFNIGDKVWMNISYPLF